MMPGLAPAGAPGAPGYPGLPPVAVLATVWVAAASAIYMGLYQLGYFIVAGAVYVAIL